MLIVTHFRPVYVTSAEIGPHHFNSVSPRPYKWGTSVMKMSAGCEYCLFYLIVSWAEENPKSFWEPRKVLTERQLCGNYFVPRCRPRAARRHFPCTARNTAQQKSNYGLIYFSNYNFTVIFLPTGRKKVRHEREILIYCITIVWSCFTHLFMIKPFSYPC